MKKLHYSIIAIIALTLGSFSCNKVEPPIVEEPNARFTYQISEQTVSFMDASVNADTYAWDFGDGNTSTEASPSHTYGEGGNFEVKLTVSNESGDDIAMETIAIEAPFNADILAGTWKVAAEEGALKVGPEKGSSEWWSLPESELSVRACYLDDEFIFNTDGSYSINMQSETFLEDWQGTNFACGTPVAPHDGAGSYTFEVLNKTFTLKGEGAFIGLPKVGNAGELPNVSVPAEITYEVVDFKDEGNTRTMILSIEAGTGVFWTFKLISQ